MTGVVSLSKYIKMLQQSIDEHEWNGEYRKADVLRLCLTEALKRQDKGDLWEPTF